MFQSFVIIDLSIHLVVFFILILLNVQPVSGQRDRKATFWLCVHATCEQRSTLPPESAHANRVTLVMRLKFLSHIRFSFTVCSCLTCRVLFINRSSLVVRTFAAVLDSKSCAFFYTFLRFVFHMTHNEESHCHYLPIQHSRIAISSIRSLCSL